MVYFAGHGATFGDTPYVVPVDAEFSSLSEVPYQLVPAETLIGELRQAKGVRVAILDACRDNAAEQELKRQAMRGGAASRGLAPMKNPAGLIIAYATQYLSTAGDGGGVSNAATRHSPFTTALLNNIATPGLDVKDMFYKVGREVNAATEGRQRPEISISMYEQYALAPTETKPAETAPPPVSAPVSEVAQAWSAIQNSTSLKALDEFLQQYGNAPIYGALARDRREALAKDKSRPPLRQMITIPAIHFAGSQNVAAASGKVAPYGDVILNAPPYNPRPNASEWKVDTSTGGRYKFEVQYAAAEPRPVTILVNGGYGGSMP